MVKKKTPGFEASLDRLDEIASLLEKGELDLQESLDLYKEGLALAAANRKLLEEAKHTVKMYGEKGLESFEDEDGQQPADYSGEDVS